MVDLRLRVRVSTAATNARAIINGYQNEQRRTVRTNRHRVHLRFRREAHVERQLGDRRTTLGISNEQVIPSRLIRRSAPAALSCGFGSGAGL